MRPKLPSRLAQELERAAARRARDRANAARWNLEVALFLFAVSIIVILLPFQGIGIEVTAPVGLFGLAAAWFWGWRKGKQLYQPFYDEEIARGEMVVICAWCGQEIGRKPGLGQSGVSHGICPECMKKYFPKTLGHDGTA